MVYTLIVESSQLKVIKGICNGTNGQGKMILFAVLGSLLDPNKILCCSNYHGLEKCYKFGQHKILA
jgi:hypothetical protein